MEKESTVRITKETPTSRLKAAGYGSCPKMILRLLKSSWENKIWLWVKTNGTVLG